MVKLGMVTIALPTLLHHQKLEGCNEFLFYSSYFKIQSLKHLQTAGVAMPVGTFTKWVFKKHSFLRNITFLRNMTLRNTLCASGVAPQLEQDYDVTPLSDHYHIILHQNIHLISTSA
jgi:hypothetical protein